MMARRGPAVLLVVLLAIPAGGSPAPSSPVVPHPIGTFCQSNFANVSGAGALAGTTVFSGDIIDVRARGSAWILLSGGMQVRVSPESSLRLRELPGGASRVEMEMFNGAAHFRTGETSSLVARLADATVRAKGTAAAAGVISVLSKKRAVIAAEKGELLLSTAHDGRSVTLREGEAVEVTLADAPTPDTPQEVPQKRAKRRGAAAPILTGPQIAIIGVVVAATLASLGITGSRDNNNLTLQQKQDAVSPFKFP